MSIMAGHRSGGLVGFRETSVVEDVVEDCERAIHIKQKGF